MSHSNMMQADSYALLRHIEVHGPRTRAEVAAGLRRGAKDVSKTVDNLVALGYLARDHTCTPINFSLTSKARAKLSQSQSPAPARAASSTPPGAVRMAPTNALRRPDSGPAPRPYTAPRAADNHAIAKPYSAAEYHPSHRHGAMQAFALPSRFGDELRYRDGRVTDMAGNPIK